MSNLGRAGARAARGVVSARQGLVAAGEQRLLLPRSPRARSGALGRARRFEGNARRSRERGARALCRVLSRGEHGRAVPGRPWPDLPVPDLDGRRSSRVVRELGAQIRARAAVAGCCSCAAAKAAATPRASARGCSKRPGSRRGSNTCRTAGTPTLARWARGWTRRSSGRSPSEARACDTAKPRGLHRAS